ncbi:hypothetical protein MSAN_00823000 [Mycena sanguinolenta]|uniref:Uncharacterized protein n=1 Tax=Mycena sanguinolenta TaxID=230812 RepID=A0A8H6YZ21_9AGAR|nr:hypothetical protein MSAN_00823000 [Mycena sanguinolenta]
MKSSTSLLALFSLVSVMVCSTNTGQGISSCKAEDRVLVDSRNVTAGGYEFQVSTKACSAAVLTSRVFQKRVYYNSCASGETLTSTYTCVTNQGTGPLEADCVSLSNALTAAYEGPGDPTLFTVSPQYAQEFSYGTCLWAWINQNPVGGAALEYCYSGLNVMGFNLDQSCIVNGDTGGYVIPSNPQLVPASLNWVFEVLHS